MPHVFAAIPEPLQVFIREWFWWTFVNGFSISLVLPGVLLFLALVLFFRVGAGLGLPLLFWRTHRGAQFLVGVGIGAVVWQVLLAGYLFEEFATNFTADRPPFCEIRPPYHQADGLPHAEFPGRFRYEPANVVSVWRYAGVVLAVGLALTVLISVVVYLIQVIGAFITAQFAGWRPHIVNRHEPPVPYGPWLPVGAIAGWAAMSALTVLAFHFPDTTLARPLGERMLASAGWGRADGRREALKEHITARAQPGASPTATDLDRVRSRTEDTARSWYRPYAVVYGLFFLNFGLILIVSAVLIALPSRFRLFTPAVGIVLLLNLTVFAHVLLSAFLPLSGDAVLIGLFVLIVVAGRAYKFSFPNVPPPSPPVLLAERYEELARVESEVTRGKATQERAADQLFASSDYRPVFPTDIPFPAAALRTAHRPPMVIVCASGGGSRAAAWTVKVLAELEKRFLAPGRGRPPVALPYHVRLVSGASGGMIGAAYYVTTLLPPTDSTRVNRVAVPRETSLTPVPLTADDLFVDVCHDFLTPITHTLVNHDLVTLFAPFRSSHDRGKALEGAFHEAFHGQLHVPFTSLRQGEAEGWRPSLVFSPMLVEDGRQLFISNLDLVSVTQNRAFILGENTTESPIDREAETALLSREGVEFFKLFPTATDFTVSTAARMSATFPYLLPAVSLPTNPPRRVVDAGYYDNFGVGIVASWLFNHMDWVKQNTAGVVVVQIRDGVSEKDRKREEVRDSFPSLVDRGMQWLSSPADGLWSARQAANAFRNDNLLHLLNDFFLANNFPQGFFATVAFEFDYGDDVTLNLTLTDDEVHRIERAVEGGAFTRRAEALVNWWHTRLASPEAPLTLPDIPDQPDPNEA